MTDPKTIYLSLFFKNGREVGNVKLACASVILRAYAIETIHLTLRIERLGKQLSSCRAPRQDGLGAQRSEGCEFKSHLGPNFVVQARSQDF